jgi:ADP-ribosylation factor-binding protein GGA
MFLQINDQINMVLNRHESFKKGDYVAAANPIPQELASTSTRNELSLIDFDEGAASNTTAQPVSLIDDLNALFGPSSAATNPTATTPPNNMSSSMFANNPYGAQNNGFTSRSAPGTPQPILGATPSQFGSITLPSTPPKNEGQSQVGRPGVPQYQNNGIANVQVQAQRPPSQPQQPQFQTTLFQVAYGQKPPSRQATPSQQPQTQPPSQFGRAVGPGPQVFVPQQQPIQPQFHPSQFGQQPLQPQQQQQPPAPSQQQQAQGKDPFADLAGLF